MRGSKKWDGGTWCTEHEFCIIFFLRLHFPNLILDLYIYIYILLQDLSPLEDPRYSSNDYCSSGLLREWDHLRNRVFAILSTEQNQIGKYPNIFCFRMTTFLGRDAKHLGAIEETHGVVDRKTGTSRKKSLKITNLKHLELPHRKGVDTFDTYCHAHISVHVSLQSNI